MYVTMYKFQSYRAVTARERLIKKKLPQWWVTRKECKKYDVDGGLKKEVTEYSIPERKWNCAENKGEVHMHSAVLKKN